MRLALLPLRFIAPFAVQTYLGVTAVITYGLHTMGASTKDAALLALKWPKLLYRSGNEDFMNEMILVTGGAGISDEDEGPTGTPQFDGFALISALDKYKAKYASQPWFSSAFVFSADPRRNPIILVRVKYLPRGLTWVSPAGVEVVHILEEVTENQAMEALDALEALLESRNVTIGGPGCWCRDAYYRSEAGPSLVIVIFGHIPEYIEDSIPYAVRGIPVVAREWDDAEEWNVPRG